VLLALGSVAVMILASPVAADLLEVEPFQDTTLIETTDGSLSNGSGEGVFVGNTSGGGGIPPTRRALLAFDLSALPEGAVVQSATLTLQLVNGPTGASDLDVLTLHEVLADWGEGASSATGGKGAPAALDDATWLHTFYEPGDPSQAPMWAQPGGDFAPLGVPISGNDGTAFWWNSPALAADVQTGVDDPASNFGWLLIGDEGVLSTALKFGSREALTVGDRPVLSITYVPEPQRALLGASAILGVTWLRFRRRLHRRGNA
jgi:hypothetical protein